MKTKKADKTQSQSVNRAGTRRGEERVAEPDIRQGEGREQDAAD